MTKNRLGSVCGALPWKLDMRSATFAVICNAQNLSTGIVLECTGTPTQKAAMNYIVQCANLMPEIERALKLYFDRFAHSNAPVTENDLKKLYNEIADITGGKKIETAI
jgi:hypothetical protein